jgi:hypothetical protein
MFIDPKSINIYLCPTKISCYLTNIIVKHNQTNIRTHVCRDQQTYLMFVGNTFVGGAWPMNISHVGLCPSSCHVCSMFVGSLTNIKAMWQSRQPWPLCSSVLKNFLFCLSLRPRSIQNMYKQTDIQYITIQQVSNTSNITSIQYIKHYKYPTPLRHINIQTSHVIECTTRHSTVSLCSTPPPLVLSTVWVKSSPVETSRCESETSMT